MPKLGKHAPEKVVLEAPLRKVETQIWCNIPNECTYRKSREISSPHLKPFSVESRKTSRGPIRPPPPPVIGLNHGKSNIISIKLFFTLFESGLNTCIFELSFT